MVDHRTYFFFFSSRSRHTRCGRDWSSDVCSSDLPSFTQPLMYARIKGRPSVRKLYTEALVNRGDLSLEDAEEWLEAFRRRLQQAFDDFREDAGGNVPEVELEHPEPMAADPAVATA